MFEFDFDKHFKEIGKNVLISATDKISEEVEADTLDFNKAVVSAVIEVYYASLDATKEVLKEYHVQLMNHLNEKV